VSEFNHSTSHANSQRGIVGIRLLVPNPSATRLAYIDDNGEGFVYNPVRLCFVGDRGLQ